MSEAVCAGAAFSGTSTHTPCPHFPPKQSAANSFGQMQITSLTPPPPTVLPPPLQRRARNGKTHTHKHTHIRETTKVGGAIKHLLESPICAKQSGRARPAVTGGERERRWARRWRHGAHLNKCQGLFFWWWVEEVRDNEGGVWARSGGS